jgi:hypothetical protein
LPFHQPGCALDDTDVYIPLFKSSGQFKAKQAASYDHYMLFRGGQTGFLQILSELVGIRPFTHGEPSG